MKLAPLAAMLLLALSADAQDPWSGSYVAKGFRPGESYQSTPSYVIDCTIEKNGDYYTIRWYEQGKLAYYGLGVHVDHVLGVSYLSVDGSVYGTVSYRDEKQKNGYLVGAWCLAKTSPKQQGNGSLGMEVLWPK